MEQSQQQPWHSEELEAQASMQEGGWDSEGNYHDPSLRIEHTLDTSRPYWFAAYLNGQVVEQASMNDYTLSSADRYDVAHGILFGAGGWVEQNALTPAEAYEVLMHWQSVHARDFRE